ncbi:DUF2213 domain-containing protein [Acinetobacter radioresistens]|uniref:DUF2213 domain-containing protein n=1 Tax=Acinetobacter radioresistens TaxID=40216 RepID=UPI000E70A102|nr:DUF2213 domain-containing protein [Acinetobacter radioresistens]RJL71649.1 DUF2213 domain-containing protein [Acinetobacter radioresistens]
MFKKKQVKDQQTKDRSNIYTTGQIGRTREMTPEGYLLCRDVPVARIGTLMYGEGEVPVTADNTGLILIQRGEDVLFDPKTIASFEGKPVTNDHPDDWVTPDNWKEISKGFGKDVRRGEGINADFLMADLLITDKDTIQAVIDGKVEISLGYDADYIEISKGKGIQSNIMGNHFALVKNGRCGSRCSIGDSFMSGKTNKKPWYQALLGAKRTIDEALEEAKKTQDNEEETEDDDEETGGKTSDAAVNRQILKQLKTMDARLAALEKKKTKDSDDPEKKETEDDDDDPEGGKETKDDGDLTKAEPAKKLDNNGVTNYTGDSLQEVRSRAEIIAPGIKLPTLDASAKDVGQVANNIKRQALKTAYATADGVKNIGPFVGGANVNLDALPAHTIDAAFIGASELIKQQNNAKGVRTGVTTKDFGRSAPTPADINARNRAYWNKG